MNKILYKLNNGNPSFWIMRDVPERPKFKGWAPESAAQKKFNRDIDLCKANALEIINPELLPVLADGYPYIENGFLNDGDIFDFPERLEFIEEEMPKAKVLGQGYHINKATAKKVIRLIPKQKEESQDELLEILFEYMQNLQRFEWNHHGREFLKSKFTIQRKK